MIRQGLWQRLTQNTEGRQAWEPQMQAGKLADFLNGPGQMASQIMFSQQERAEMQDYLRLMQQLISKPGAINYSGTAGVLAMLARHKMMGIGATLGHTMLGPVGGAAGAAAGHFAGEAMRSRNNAGMVARSLYNTPAQNQAEQQFIEQMGRYGGLGSRMISGGSDSLQQPGQQ